MRILKIVTELMREGKLADEEPPLFLVEREMGNLYSLSTQETPFQEMETPTIG